MMRFILLAFLIMLASISFSQGFKGIGVKGGYNFNYVNQIPSIKSSEQSGFMIGLFWSNKSAKFLGYQSELLFSRQGYNFETQTSAGSVKMNYALMPQLLTLRLSRFVQLEIGGQLAYLINAKADSVTNNPSSEPDPTIYQKATDYFKRLNQGFAGGITIYPNSRIIVGTRMNANFGKLQRESYSGPIPPYIPRDNKSIRSGLIQLYLGVRL